MTNTTIPIRDLRAPAYPVGAQFSLVVTVSAYSPIPNPSTWSEVRFIVFGYDGTTYTVSLASTPPLVVSVTGTNPYVTTITIPITHANALIVTPGDQRWQIDFKITSSGDRDLLAEGPIKIIKPGVALP